jgi:hypothetical protein
LALLLLIIYWAAPPPNSKYAKNKTTGNIRLCPFNNLFFNVLDGQ